MNRYIIIILVSVIILVLGEATALSGLQGQMDGVRSKLDQPSQIKEEMVLLDRINHKEDEITDAVKDIGDRLSKFDSQLNSLEAKVDK